MTVTHLRETVAIILHVADGKMAVAAVRTKRDIRKASSLIFPLYVEKKKNGLQKVTGNHRDTIRLADRGDKKSFLEISLCYDPEWN